MEFFTKSLFFCVLIATTYGRSISEGGTNNFDRSEDENCRCDWRYFKHYETKGCVVETVDSCGCPKKFSCALNLTQQAPSKVCIHQNQEYKVGSKITTSSICQVCKCRDGVPPYISCVTRECPEIQNAQGKDCHLVYNANKCCPVGVECLEYESESSEILRNNTCEYNDKLYPFGSKIYPVDDPCQTCVCNENWSGIDNGSCYEQDCIFEKNKLKLDAGCIPVYHEKRCCPIEFYCPSSHNLSYTQLSSNESSENITAYDNHCGFAGQFYELGEELSINNPCVKCSCSVPPDFTCVHQTCPPSPSEENCYRIYTSGECCPSYECMLGDAAELSDCPTPLCADATCKIDIPFGQRCPSCVCRENGCPTPLCADSSCRIETPPGHECPTCVCGVNDSELEHNNLEQVQQISQNVEQMGLAQQIYEHRENVDDYSEDELQMMPLQMRDSEGQLHVLERMILSEHEGIDQYAEGLRELEESSIEDNSSSEAVNTASDELTISKEKNSTFLPEPGLNDTYSESVSDQSEKAVQKRSDVSDTGPGERESSQEEMQQFNEDIEREGSDLEENGDDFDDEIESFKNKIFDKNGTIINEIININHEVRVPPGCPTPLCEGPWCIIGIPPGHECPTCICKRHIDSEP